MSGRPSPPQNGIVQVSDLSLTLDFQQLKDITLDDAELMREVLFALIDDTSRQLVLLAGAIRQHDSQRLLRLAHYSKGACANVGANRAAAMLKQIEQDAARSAFDNCSLSLGTLVKEIEQLRREAAAI